MRVWAVLLSPLGGAISLFLPLFLWSVFTINNFIEIVKFATSIIAFIYLIALTIQVIIVEVIMLSNDFLYSLRGYCWLAFSLSFCFAIPISGILESDLVSPFVCLLIYSIGNILTYNELYFKRLEN